MKILRGSIFIAAVISFALFTSGCTTTQKRAGTGAAVGAGAGALIGSESGNAGKGAIIGAAAGGVAGAIYDADQKSKGN